MQVAAHRRTSTEDSLTVLRGTHFHPNPNLHFPARSLLPGLVIVTSVQTMLQHIQHKSRLEPTSRANYHYNSSSSPAFGRPKSSSHQTQSQYPSYSSNAFADMVGSFSVQQPTHQMRSPWYSPPPAPQRYAPSSRRAATFTARSPPSPSNSSYTTTSSNTSSFISQPGQSSGIDATHRPLASWTHGSNIWRKRLIGMSIDDPTVAFSARKLDGAVIYDLSHHAPLLVDHVSTID